MNHPPSPRTIRAIAVQADTDPRTVVRYLTRKPMRPTCAERIRQALDHLKLNELAPPQTPDEETR